MEKVMKRNNPSVGLVNIGTEEHKGTAMTKDDLVQMIETLTESQVEYLCHLVTILFSQPAD
jgi:fatty acid/phospholipid biosynthesis enzyme